MSVLEFDLEKQLKFAKADGREEGRTINLITMVCRKLKKGKLPEIIAEELDEDEELIGKICMTANEFAPEYDVEQIYNAIKIANSI